MQVHGSVKRDAESGQRLFLVGIDESHVDSRDALLAARSFARYEDRITLMSVLDLVQCTPEKKQTISKAFGSYLAECECKTELILATKGNTIAQGFLKEAIAEDASMLLLGSGTKLSAGALGSVVSEVAINSKRHICIVKPGRALQPKKGKHVILGVAGDVTSKNGVKALLELLNPALDTLEIVTISHHEGKNDQKALAEAEAAVASTGTSIKVSFKFIVRKAGNSIGQVLLDYGDETGASMLAVATSRTSASELGSVSNFIATHGPMSVLILKVPGDG